VGPESFSDRGEEESDADFIRRLHSYLKSSLPAPLMPRFIVTLSFWPLNSEGDLDLPALPRPYGAGLLAGRDKAPKSFSELLVSKALRETLKTGDLYLNDSFIALGGDSLSAMEFSWRLSSALGFSPGLEEILNAQSLREIASSLDRILEESGTPILNIRNGRGPYLAIAPGLSASLVAFRDLLSAWPEEQGIVCLNPFLERGFFHRLKNINPTDHLPVMVEDYGKELAKRFPGGDFILVGQGFKAMSAWETCRQYEELTLKSPQCLLLLDPLSPQGVLERPLEEEAEELLASLKYYEGFNPKRRESRQRVTLLEISAWRSYKPLPLKAPVLSLRPHIASPYPIQPRLSVPTPLASLVWGNFREETLPADHYSLIHGKSAAEAVLRLNDFIKQG
jgi:acyl carrier protein